VRVPVRIAQALDDLATLAERARRDPDPVEEVRGRLDVLLAELQNLNLTARDIVDGGEELTEVARELRDTAREIVLGGQELTATARVLDAHTTELEDSVDTVADTVAPLQGAAERVGRVTQRFSRSSAS
jgi:methyl-accepting chemotaxis protein